MTGRLGVQSAGIATAAAAVVTGGALVLGLYHGTGTAAVPVWLLAVLCATAGYLSWVARRMAGRIDQLREQRDHLQVEETRVFDFLHELGDAFKGDPRPAELHTKIVNGAVKILEAHGGALYLINKAGELAPISISKGCPPLVQLPAHIRTQAEATPHAVESYIRLHHVKRDEGLLGACWRDSLPRLVADARAEPELAPHLGTQWQVDSILLSPLVYAGQNLGVLAVANGPLGAAFSDADFIVFKAIAEQSAFALHAASMFAEAHEKRRIDHDLETAREIQRILLPSGSPELSGFEICGVNLPARGVSGDYFDYLHISDQALGVAIADVSGKGIPASLIMAMCRSALRSAAGGKWSPAEVLRAVNRQLFHDIKEDMFVSAAYLVLDLAGGVATLARAGHDAPLHYVKATGEVTPLKPPGMALGIDSGGVFDRVIKDQTVALAAGDCLVLYTDGATEALDASGTEFGLENLQRTIRENAPHGPGALIRRLTDELREFAEGQPQHDDITLIIIAKK